MNFLQYLPSWVACQVNEKSVREIRLRNGSGVRVNVDGDWYWCGQNSLVTDISFAKTLDVDCQQIVNYACQNSLYAYEKLLAKGFFTLADGVRLGVAGEYSLGGSVFKNYTSICLRVPHCVECVSKEIMQQIACKNTLVIGAPATGKTTILRSISKQLSQRQNVVVADERGELAIQNELTNCDVLKWTSKSVALPMAVQCLSPQYLICDELSNGDFEVVQQALSSGVYVGASLHARDYDDAVCRSRSLLELFDIAIVCQAVGKYELQFLS